jgi:hypothetical protein
VSPILTSRRLSNRRSGTLNISMPPITTAAPALVSRV